MRALVSKPAKAFTRGAALATLAMALSLSAVGQQSRVYREAGGWVEEISGSLPAASVVTARVPFGYLSVNGSDQPNITYRLKKRDWSSSEAAARQQFQKMRFTASKVGKITVLQAQAVDSDERNGRAELWVFVPRSVKLVKVHLRGGSQQVGNVDGRIELLLGGGKANIDGIRGSVLATVGMGMIQIGRVEGDLTVRTDGARIMIDTVQGQIRTTSGGGDISVGSASQGIVAETSSGDIQVKFCGGDLRASTGGGSLSLGQVNGSSVLHTGGGSIFVGSANGLVTASTDGGTIQLWGLARGANVQTGIGQITAEFIDGHFNDSSLQTPTGDVFVYLSPRLKATVRGSIEFANGHQVVSSIPAIRVNWEGNAYGGPATAYADGDLNGGGPVLRVRTSNGNLVFRHSSR